MGNVSELAKLFSSQMDGKVNTGEFLQKMADIMSRCESPNVKFDVFICTKRRFLTLREKKSFNWDNILPFLFEKCGERGWEVEKTEVGWYDIHFTYDIYLAAKCDIYLSMKEDL